MISISVTSIKKAISEFHEDSTQFTTQHKLVPLLLSGRPRETSRRPSVFENILNSSADTVGEDSMQPSRREGNTVRTRSLKFNEETHEVRYGSRLLFVVQTPTVYVRMSPRELRIILVLGL
jgi:hypothetical protein